MSILFVYFYHIDFFAVKSSLPAPCKSFKKEKCYPDSDKILIGRKRLSAGFSVLSYGRTLSDEKKFIIIIVLCQDIYEIFFGGIGSWQE